MKESVQSGAGYLIKCSGSFDGILYVVEICCFDELHTHFYLILMIFILILSHFDELHTHLISF